MKLYLFGRAYIVSARRDRFYKNRRARKRTDKYWAQFGTTLDEDISRLCYDCGTWQTNCWRDAIDGAYFCQSCYDERNHPLDY